MIKTENIHIVSSYFGPQQIKHILLHIHSYRGCSKLQMGPMEKKTRQRIYTLAFDKKLWFIVTAHSVPSNIFFLVKFELDKAKEGKSIVQKEFQRDLKGISPRNIV